MPTLRFILGRAGSGKTHHCLESIRAELRDWPDGAPLILLAPEQSTFQLEYALATTPGIGGSFRAHVLSFRRLAHRLFDELGGRTIPPAGNLKRLLILKDILAKHHRQLQFYGASSRSTGFAQSIDATLTEWRRYRFSPEQADALAGGWMQGDHARPLLARKLKDLALVEREYRKAISGRFIDSEDYLARFASLCAHSTFLKDAAIWVDGFADLTTLERNALIALLCVAKQSEIALCLDPETLDQSRPDRLETHHPRPFSVCEKTFWSLTKDAEEAGLAVLEPLALKSAHRFVHSSALSVIEKNFFPISSAACEPSGGSSVRLVRAQSHQAEIEFVAFEALRLAREEGIRYGEMAIITRDLERSHDLLQATLARFNIPFFMDRQREILCHPLVGLLTAAAEIAASGWDSRDVVQALKSDLLPITRHEADRLENYALEWGIDGEKWQATPKEEDLVAPHERAISILAQFDKALGHRTALTSAQAFVTSIRQLIVDTNACQKLKEWEQEAIARGDVELAAEHRQLPDMLEGLFDEWVDALGTVPAMRRECADMLAEGLAALRLRMTPPALDHLLVGSVERSRHPDLKVVFLIGMNAGLFPKASSEDILLNDADRAELAQSGIELAPTAAERLLNEPYLAYIALTRASEQLVITCSRSDENCRLQEPSPYLERVAALTQKSIQDVAAAHCEFDRIVDLPSLGAEVSSALGRFLMQDGDTPPCVPWPALLNLGRQLDDASHSFSCRIGGSVYRNVTSLSPELAKALYLPFFERGCGITSLETFGQCPFHYFLQIGLGLQPRKEFQLEATDKGSILHEVLSKLFQRLQRNGKGWHDVGQEEIARWTVEAFEECTAQFRDGLLHQSARNRHMLQGLLRLLHERVRVLCEEARCSRFRQVDAEAVFGPGKPCPPLEIDLSNGAKLRLRGMIDRVDVCETDNGELYVRVIDFKTRAKNFDLVMAYAGIQLQLPAYLKAISYNRGKECRPAGFFFAPILPERSRIQPLDSPDENGDPYLAAFQGDGFFDDALIAFVDSQLCSERPKSPFWKLSRNSDGRPRKDCAAISRENLALLLSHMHSMLRQFGDRILSGELTIDPCEYGYFGSCNWCEFAPICRFDESLQERRVLEKLNRDQAFDAMRLAALGGER